MKIHVDSRAWTGIEPNHWEQEGLPRSLGFELWWEDRRARTSAAFKALAMLWGEPIPSRPRDRRKGWTVYDGHDRCRGDDWTLWRGIWATIAILTLRRHTQRQLDLHGYQSSFDLGFWDYDSGGGFWSCWVLQLYPGCRVDIFTDHG